MPRIVAMRPRTIPRFELGAELGRGAYSVVFRGTRDQVAYAVKMPRVAETEADRATAYRRFLREAVALARVRHPYLPAVMEVGRSDGVPYLVMELASGETLAERIERGFLDEPSTVELAQKVASALAAIHDAGLVHRDVKPRNIVFDSSSNGVRLVDLGSAAIADQEISAAGTRSYAAPELLSHEVRAADARSDLYSLGRVLVDCLGVAVRPGDAVTIAPFRDRGISAEFARIIVRLTSSSPEERPAGALALLTELGQLEHSREHIVPPRSRFRLLGRDAALDQLRRLWADAQRAGRVVFLEGAPGSGKTRLAKAFLDDLSQAGVTVLVASCRPRDPRAFSAVRQLIDEYLRTLEQKSPAEYAKGIADLRKLAADLGSTLKLLSPAVAKIFKDAPTLPASENAEQAFAEAVADFVEKLIRKVGPAVIFVDDVQWMDASSRRVLSRAANRVAELKGMFLFTHRQGDPTSGASITEVLSAPVARVSVTNLSGDEIVEFARDYLAARELDAPVKQALLRLSDGMPLGTLEVLRTLVDEGVLLPFWGRWQLDGEALLAMHLPSEASSLLRRRIESLDPRVRAVLSVAAVVGGAFEVDLLRKLEGDSVLAILEEARWSQLVEPAEEARYRFIHQTIPETLLSVLDAGQVASIHQRVAVALDTPRRPDLRPPTTPGAEGFARPSSSLDADPIYRIAFHYGSGQLESTPQRTAEANIAAGLAAEARFDNERAKTFFETAEAALKLVGRTLDAETRLLLAEARLRVGEHEGALEEFNRALGASSNPILRGKAWGRVAFVNVMQLDTKRAWSALERAFAELGEQPPSESPIYAAGSAAAWLTRLVPRRLRALASPTDRERDELLCSLYYEAGRVAFAANQPARIILSALRALEPADRLGPSAVQAKSYLVYAFVLTVLGFPAAGSRYLATAEQIGRRLNDPVIYSHALQLRSVVAAWGGKFQEAIDAASRCVLQYGRWRELNDFCVNCYDLFQIEACRGRDIEAWKWLDVAIDRVNGHDGAPAAPEYLLLAARAALVGLGREGDTRVLFQRLERVTVPIPRDSGAYAMTFSPRVRRLTDKGDLGPEFQALVAEFRSLRQDPKRAPLSVADYYLHIAHAFVHRALRASPDDKKRALSELALAIADLRATTRHFPVVRAHLLAVVGYEHLFHGRLAAAHESFDAAEHLAIAETVPWVQYAVYRGRAHALRASGRLDGARDMAVLADSVAMQHGSVYRARWVREEFDLRARRSDGGEYLTGSVPDTSGFDETATLVPGGSRARRQLRALLRISRARAQELAPDHQSRVVVDEVVQALRASRGFLFLTASVARVEESDTTDRNSALVLIAGRDVDGHDLGEHEDYHRNILRDALLSAEYDLDDRKARAVTTARFCAIAAPLVVDDVAAGVIYLDRPLSAGAFSDVDGEVLGALAGQVSVALELTQTLRARERAEESLRNAEKMEAVARLARGIAHDLNNMLSAIRLATVAMMTEPGASAVVGEDVRTIQSALQRANELTKQLGTFSRGELSSPQPVRLNSRIERLLPVMEGLVGDTIVIEARATSRMPAILIDPDQFDQVLMNLFVNARDAMPNGGKITLDLSEVSLDEAYRREHPRVEPGRYVRLVLTDTGVGIDDKIRHKIFEPYFTTKEERGGTGLGLSSVYWVVSQSGGHVDVSSTVGAGATFTVHFPVPFVPSAHADSRRGRRSRPPTRQTVLLVDQDPISGRELGQMLAEHGYRVLTARSGAEALALGKKRHENIDLLLADVVMEGMNGLELARELRSDRPNLPVVLVSGDASGVLAERGILGGEIDILTKPVASDALARRVKAALGRTQRGAAPK